MRENVDDLSGTTLADDFGVCVFNDSRLCANPRGQTRNVFFVARMCPLNRRDVVAHHRLFNNINNRRQNAIQITVNLCRSHTHCGACSYLFSLGYVAPLIVIVSQ